MDNLILCSSSRESFKMGAAFGMCAHGFIFKPAYPFDIDILINEESDIENFQKDLQAIGSDMWNVLERMSNEQKEKETQPTAQTQLPF